MVPTIFAGVVVLAGLLCSRAGALYWQMVFCLFGATTALSLPALGGAVITPAVLFLPFVVLRAWLQEHNKHYTARVPGSVVWLALAVLCGALAAAFVPRFLAGEMNILTVDYDSNVVAAVLMPLRPVSGNVTQTGYAIGAVIGFASLRVMLEKPGRLEHFGNAVLLLGGLNCLAALINLAEFHLGFPPTLTYVRTAYALFEAYEGAGGLMRIHGTFPEASAFAGFTLPLFAFSFSLWLNRVRSQYSGPIALMLLVFLMISTSTTAYVGLALYAATLVFILTYRGYVRGTVPRIGLLVSGALLTVVIFGSFFVFDTGFAETLQDYFSLTVIEKMDSSSAVERGSWNHQAWTNFLDTYGVGVGLGSARASSFILVLLSNLGALGTLFFLCFLKRVIGNLGHISDPVSEASRQGFLAALAGALVSGAVFDQGVAFYAYAAAASITGASAVSHHADAWAPSWLSSRPHSQ